MLIHSMPFYGILGPIDFGPTSDRLSKVWRDPWAGPMIPVLREGTLLVLTSESIQWKFGEVFHCNNWSAFAQNHLNEGLQSHRKDDLPPFLPRWQFLPVGERTNNLTDGKFMVKHPTHKYLEHQWHYIHHQILSQAIDLFSTPANQIVAHKVPKWNTVKAHRNAILNNAVEIDFAGSAVLNGI